MGDHNMKLGYALILVLFATPALSESTKSANDVTFECVVTGSDKDGFDLTAEYDGKDVKQCTASCQLTTGDDRKTKEYTYPDNGTKKLSQRSGKQWLGGEAGLSGKPLSNPDVTKASCD
jgi:hypothetical protein